jgi:oligopeptide transport system substrate-binding protein
VLNAAPSPAAAPAASPAAQAAAPAAPAAAPADSRPAAAAAQQVFRFAHYEPVCLDVGLCSDATSYQYYYLMWEGLLGFDQQNKIRYLGAESYDMAKDASTFTFKLRKEAKFSDGSPITARDYEWTIKRNLDPASGSKYAQSLYPIKNAAAFNRGEIKDRDAVGIKALDDYTLQITTQTPAAYLPTLIAGAWTMYPLKQATIEKFGDKWVAEAANIVSNGPFMMQSWKHDEQIVLVPNPYYWGPKPALQRVEVTLLQNPEGQALVAYERGELDYAVVPPADIDRVKSNPTLSQQSQRVTQLRGRWVLMDTKNPPFDNLKVRQAFYLAIDRKTMAENVFKGMPTPSWTLMPPNVAGHNPAAKIDGGPEDAKRLFAEAGFPNGQGFPEVELVAANSTEYKLQSEALQQNWKTVLGVNTKITLMDQASFLSFRRTRKDQPFQQYLTGWGMDYADPYNQDNFLFDSKSDFFNTHWKNDNFDQLIAKAAGETDPATRKQLYEQAEVILVRDVPVAPFYFQAFMVVVKPSVQGLVFTQELGNLRLDWTKIVNP